MQNRSTILMLIDDNTCLRYFHPIITLLLKKSQCDLILVARTGKLADDIRRHFPNSSLLAGYTQETLKWRFSQ